MASEGDMGFASVVSNAYRNDNHPRNEGYSYLPITAI
jgi:hypothetical protein